MGELAQRVDFLERMIGVYFLLSSLFVAFMAAYIGSKVKERKYFFGLTYLAFPVIFYLVDGSLGNDSFFEIAGFFLAVALMLSFLPKDKSISDMMVVNSLIIGIAILMKMGAALWI